MLIVGFVIRLGLSAGVSVTPVICILVTFCSIYFKNIRKFVRGIGLSSWIEALTVLRPGAAAGV